MRVGIRTKLVILLVTVAFLPLLAELLTIVIGSREMKNELFGKNVLSLVTAEVNVMEVELRKNIEILSITLQEPRVIDQVEAANEVPNNPLDNAAFDRKWGTYSETSGPLRKVLVNLTSQILKTIINNNDLIVELMVTDKYGRLIAANRRTTDYDQHDEEWWQKAWNDGKGEIYIPPAMYDESAKAWGIEICLPIMKGKEVIGVVKGVIDLREWLPECRRNIGLGTGYIYLINQQGIIFHSRDIAERMVEAPQLIKYEHWSLASPKAHPDGEWTLTDNNILLAYCPLSMPRELNGINVVMDPWTLLMEVPENEARRSITQISLIFLLVGIVIIIAIFLFGVLLIDRSIINRIKRISNAARKIAKGDLQHRVPSNWSGGRLFGKDEIDDLAHDFNNMVRRLEKSYNELTEANELKENFIRIAGHELRTPVSYIVGMASLMQKSKDPERLSKAIDTMGFKASRLDEIIQAMFKLIPDQSLSERMRYSNIRVEKLLSEVEESMKPWVDRRRQKLIVKDETNNSIISADEGKLRDIIENLLMNAVKFTPDEGWVKLTVQRRLGGLVAFQITDQGPGIPETDQPHIFEPFYSGSDTLHHSTGKSGFGKKGMGLGLAIVKHFVDLHRGTLSFISGPTGTTFTVEIPADPSWSAENH